MKCLPFHILTVWIKYFVLTHSKSRPSLDIVIYTFLLYSFLLLFWFLFVVFYIIYFVLFLHCLSYLLTGNIFLYKYLLLTMHKASRPMYLSDITIQLSGAKSHSRVYNRYKLHFSVYLYCHALTYPNSDCYIMQKSRDQQSFIWLKFSKTSTTLVQY